jgi:hypothetical protein
MFEFYHAITHDLSKFLPSEFVPYARHFYGGDEPGDGFDTAWLLHQHRNQHHWDYWVRSDGKPVPMPPKNITQMVCDWRAMARANGGNAKQWYNENKGRMVLHENTIMNIEKIL